MKESFFTFVAEQANQALRESTVTNLFRQMHARGHTIVLVTHDATVGALANRLVRLEHGRIEGDGRGDMMRFILQTGRFLTFLRA